MTISHSRNPTLDDVAVLAGVSSATVSRYVNNPGMVAPKTAERIQRAIDESGYIPNLLAGGLASSKSRMVAVLIPHITDSIFSGTIQAMVEELGRAGMMVMLGVTGVEMAQTNAFIQAAISRRVDAIITTAPIGEQTVALVHRFPGLFIQIWELPEEPLGIAVGFSHFQVGEETARFLFDRGYQAPLLIVPEGARARMRADGFSQGWSRLGGGKFDEIVVDTPSRFGQARRVFAELRRFAKQPDVVVCGSDYLAQGLIIEAQAAGLRVPEDLAVMGFGNSSVASDMRPTISTVDIDGAHIAREAINAIKLHAEGKDPVQRPINVGFRLIARESA